MRAARWDTTWEHGSLWRRVLRRRLPAVGGVTGEALPWAATVMHVIAPDGTTLAEITGELVNDDLDLVLARSSAQTTAVDPGRYRHRVVTRNADLDDDEVLLRGFVTVGPPEASP